jgi:hypothetical protein
MNTLPTWRRERYENARNVLLEAGLIVTISPYKRVLVKGKTWGRAARYTLAEEEKRVLQAWGAGGTVTLS